MKLVRIFGVLVIAALMSCSQEASEGKDAIDPMDADKSSAVEKADDNMAGDNTMAYNFEEHDEEEKSVFQQPRTVESFDGIDFTEFPNKKKPSTFEERISYGMGYDMIMNLRKQMVPIDYEYLILGILNARANNDKFVSLKELFDTQKEYMNWYESNVKIKQQRRIEEMEVMRKRNDKENKKLAKEFREQRGVKIHESDLAYIVMTEGSGPTPKPEDMIKYDFQAYDFWGNKIMDTRERPLNISPANQLLAGLQVMSQDMKPGEKRKVLVPPQLGSLQLGPDAPVPPNTFLIFEFEFIGYPTFDEIKEHEKMMERMLQPSNPK